jgi:hypothetical protein
MCIMVLLVAADQTSDRGQLVTPQVPPCQGHLAGELFARTELFFGLSKPDGAMVTEDRLKGFLDKEITPRFPDGLTVLMGDGRFRTKNGRIMAEKSVVVILLYPVVAGAKNQHIEAIREAYKLAFQQESVLRVDSFACATF